MLFSEQDIFYMKRALHYAKRSLKKQEVPVGAVIVSDDQTVVVGAANAMERYKSQQYHAEMRALRRAFAVRKDWRLDDCTIYITLEPCLMCLGALLLSRVKRIVYGAPSPLFGALRLLPDLTQGYRQDVVVDAGLQEQKCSDILKHFFGEVRQQKKNKKSPVKG